MMKQLNRYYRCAKISERKTRQILRFFALDLTANKTAELVSITHQSVNRIFLKIRERSSEEAERASPFSSCEVAR
jgi:transposase-like protein